MKKSDIIATINIRIDSMYSKLSTEKQEHFSDWLHRIGEEFMTEIIKELDQHDDSHITTIPTKVSELAEEWERVFQRICSSEVVTEAIIGDTGIAAIDGVSGTIARENTEEAAL